MLKRKRSPLILKASRKSAYQPSSRRLLRSRISSSSSSSEGESSDSELPPPHEVIADSPSRSRPTKKVVMRRQGHNVGTPPNRATDNDTDFDPKRNISSARESRPTISKEEVTLYDGMRMPIAITNLAPFSPINLPEDPCEEFSFEFLREVLGGSHLFNGWYIKNPIRRGGSESTCTASEPSFSVKIYMLLNGDHNPLLPVKPGDHGAQISPYLGHLPDNLAVEGFLTGMPLFIRYGGRGYRYYGTYRETRYPDRLGANEMRRELPLHVKEHWAQKLGAKRKSFWAMEAIRSGWPKEQLGWYDDETKSMIHFDPDLEEIFGEPMMRKISESEADKITPQEIMAAFEAPDGGLQPVIRCFYEYLQCHGYDREFYEHLVSKNKSPKDRL